MSTRLIYVCFLIPSLVTLLHSLPCSYTGDLVKSTKAKNYEACKKACLSNKSCWTLSFKKENGKCNMFSQRRCAGPTGEGLEEDLDKKWFSGAKKCNPDLCLYKCNCPGAPDFRR